MTDQETTTPVHGLPEWMFGAIIVGLALVTLHAYRMRHLDGYLTSATFMLRSAAMILISVGVYYAWERISRSRRGRGGDV